MAGSSRWMARPVGRWLENPRPRSSRHTCVVLYARPNWTSNSAPTRASVHSSVGNPHATAPATSRLARRDFSAVDNPAGRPSGLRRQACVSAVAARAQFDTVCRLTSRARATSACVTPRASMRMPLRRRCSSAFRSRLYFTVAMPSPRDRERITINARDLATVVKPLRKAQ
jgi:hypothetical protein